MGSESCGVCGTESAVDGARFCHACGAGLTTPLVDLGQVDADPVDDHPSDRHPFGVVAAILAGVGLMALLLSVLADDAESDDRPDRADEVAAAPLASDLAEEDDSERTPPPTSSTTSSSTTTTTMAGPAPPVDPSLLPGLDATHLVVQSGRELQFLDLQTGIWSRSELESTAVGVDSVAGGVVLRVPSGAVRYAPVDGGPHVDLSDSQRDFYLGVSDGLVVVSEFDGAVARHLDGSEARRIELPDQAWPVGLAPDGRLIIQALETVALYDPSAESAVTLGTGQVVGMIEDLVLVSTCHDGLDCGVDQINLDTGARTRVVDRIGWFDTSAGSPGQAVFHERDGAAPSVFAVVDGVLTQTDSSLLSQPGTEVSTTDPTTGITITHAGDTIEFVRGGGEVVAEISAPIRSTHSSHITLVRGG